MIHETITGPMLKWLVNDFSFCMSNTSKVTSDISMQRDHSNTDSVSYPFICEMALTPSFLYYNPRNGELVADLYYAIE